MKVGKTFLFRVKRKVSPHPFQRKAIGGVEMGTPRPIVGNALDMFDDRRGRRSHISLLDKNKVVPAFGWTVPNGIVDERPQSGITHRIRTKARARQPPNLQSAHPKRPAKHSCATPTQRHSPARGGGERFLYRPLRGLFVGLKHTRRSSA